MAQQVFKITNAPQVKMLETYGRVSDIDSITIANIHSSEAVVDLFLANATDNYYIFKNLVIPTGATLKLEGNEVSFDNKIFNLYIKLAGSTPVDVVINN